MKTASRNIRGVAVALCTVFALCLFAVTASAVDVARKCSITLKIAESVLTDAEKEGLQLTTNLYKLADFVDGKYDYAPAAAFAPILPSLAGYKDFTDAEVKAAAEAAAVVVANDDTLTPEKTISFDASASGTAADLPCGLYLLLTTAVDATGEYIYEFTPVLLSLPSMSSTDGSDIYDVTNAYELKFERTPAKTSIVIEKNLSRYSELQGPATFIFQVEATKDGKTVYSNVISMVFTAAGSQTVQIDNLPVGATVTVSEVYGGGSYTATTDAVQVIAALEPDVVPTVSFTNDYNEHGQNSHSVTNYFAPSDDNSRTSWSWTPFADVTPDAQ